MARMTPEGRLKDDVVKFLFEQDETWFWCVQDRYTAGIPDIVGCHRGIFFAIELKAEDGKETALQTYNLKRIKRFGGRSISVKRLSEVKKFFKGVENAARKYRSAVPRTPKRKQ